MSSPENSDASGITMQARCLFHHGSLDVVAGDGDSPQKQAGVGRSGCGKPFLMVTFACAGAYVKVFRSLDGTHYLARCPKCAKTMRFEVGDAGSQQRTFSVSCG